MSDWQRLTRPEKIRIASEAIRYLRELRITYPYQEIYISERQGHYPILGLIERWIEVLEDLDGDRVG